MKPKASLNILHGVGNIISLNMIRLRRRMRRDMPAHAETDTKPQSGYLRRQAIKARTGGYCRD
jgi:hypothetical protein